MGVGTCVPGFFYMLNASAIDDASACTLTLMTGDAAVTVTIALDSGSVTAAGLPGGGLLMVGPTIHASDPDAGAEVRALLHARDELRLQA